jgi:hypothetical protein
MNSRRVMSNMGISPPIAAWIPCGVPWPQAGTYTHASMNRSTRIE